MEKSEEHLSMRSQSILDSLETIAKTCECPMFIFGSILNILLSSQGWCYQQRALVSHECDPSDPSQISLFKMGGCYVTVLFCLFVFTLFCDIALASLLLTTRLVWNTWFPWCLLCSTTPQWSCCLRVGWLCQPSHLMPEMNQQLISLMWLAHCAVYRHTPP